MDGTRIFSYSDRSNLVDLASSFAGYMKQTYPQVKEVRNVTLDHVQAFMSAKCDTVSQATLDQYASHNNFKVLSSKALWTRFAKLLKGAGVDRCGIHSLRHTCATLLYEESAGDAKFVCEQLRQKDPGFTARTYIHQSKKRKKELLANFQI